jgi:hypothetical protein
MPPPIGAGLGLAAGACAGAAFGRDLRAVFFFAGFALFVFIPFFFRAGAARFAAFFDFFAFAFFRFFAIALILVGMVQPAR